MLCRPGAVQNQVQAKYSRLVRYIVLLLRPFCIARPLYQYVWSQSRLWDADVLYLFRDPFCMAFSFQLSPTLLLLKRLDNLTNSFEADIAAEHITIGAGTFKVFPLSGYPEFASIGTHVAVMPRSKNTTFPH